MVLGDVKFTEKFSTRETWKKDKGTTPFGHLPVLTVYDKDGKACVLSQTRAIQGYLGRKCGLYPSDVFQAGQVDEIQNVVEDILMSVLDIKKGEDEEKDKWVERRKAAVAKDGKTRELLDKLDAYIAANGKDGHVVGKELTMA